MTLKVYAAPLRPLPVAEVSTQDVLRVLQPLWTTKPTTASRLRGRIESVIDAARAGGHIPDTAPNPARWSGHLEMILSKPAKSSEHFAAMPVADVPAFMTRLRELEADSVAALALEFAILTACRSGEVLGARWDEIDMEARVWTIPEQRTKSLKEHRIPYRRALLKHYAVASQSAAVSMSSPACGAVNLYPA